MDYHRKRTVATIVLIVALGLTFWGFRRMQIEAFSGHISMFTKTAFFSSVVIGLIAAVGRIYWKSLENQDYNGSKIAMDTMGALGRQKLEEKQKRQNQR